MKNKKIIGNKITKCQTIYTPNNNVEPDKTGNTRP